MDVVSVIWREQRRIRSETKKIPNVVRVAPDIMAALRREFDALFAAKPPDVSVQSVWGMTLIEEPGFLPGTITVVWEKDMADIEIVISDGEESFALIARPEGGGWMPFFEYVVGDGRLAGRPLCVHRVAEAGPYPTPGKCILALAEAVVSELCGVRV